MASRRRGKGSVRTLRTRRCMWRIPSGCSGSGRRPTSRWPSRPMPSATRPATTAGARYGASRHIMVCFCKHCQEQLWARLWSLESILSGSRLFACCAGYHPGGDAEHDLRGRLAAGRPGQRTASEGLPIPGLRRARPGLRAVPRPLRLHAHGKIATLSRFGRLERSSSKPHHRFRAWTTC